MNKLITSVALLLLVPFLLARAEEHARISPHETVSATIDGANIKIVYGRPYTRDPKTKEMRKIWGGLVPFGQVWRMGADEATMLTTDHEIALGGTRIPAGSYSLFLQPEESGPGRLIVNKQIGQWGTKYDAGQDFVRIDMERNALTPAVDQFVITIDKNASGDGGTLRLKWERFAFSAPIRVPIRVSK